MNKNNNILVVLGSVLLTILTAVVVINILNVVNKKELKNSELSWNFSEGNSGLLNLEIISETEVKTQSSGSFSVTVFNENINSNTNYTISIDEKNLPDSISFNEVKSSGVLKPGESNVVEFKWENKANKDSNKPIVVGVLISGSQEE